MSVTKVNADVFDLTDAYAFSGTVTGAGIVQCNQMELQLLLQRVMHSDTLFLNMTREFEVLIWLLAQQLIATNC